MRITPRRLIRAAVVILLLAAVCGAGWLAVFVHEHQAAIQQEETRIEGGAPAH